MIACSILSILMLGAAGTMIDVQRRDWLRRWGGGRKEAASGDGDAQWRFALSRHRRRMTAAVLLAVAGVLIALWPVTPRTPWWVVNYTGALSLTALGLLACGLYDAVASSRYYRRLSRDLAARQRRELERLVESRKNEATQGRDAPDSSR